LIAAVDDERCRGHGVCTSVCPDVFALNDDGYAEVLLQQVPADLEDDVLQAVRQCPEKAISTS
jgi:ferredoxin